VVSLWEHGPCLLMGHGAFHLVPREHALRVRLLAPLSRRTAELAREERLDARAASRELARRDSEQVAYHRRYFHADLADAH